MLCCGAGPGSRLCALTAAVSTYVQPFTISQACVAGLLHGLPLRSGLPCGPGSLMWLARQRCTGVVRGCSLKASGVPLLGRPAADLVSKCVHCDLTFLAAVYVSMRAPRHTAQVALAAFRMLPARCATHSRGREATLLLYM